MNKVYYKNTFTSESYLRVGLSWYHLDHAPFKWNLCPRPGNKFLRKIDNPVLIRIYDALDCTMALEVQIDGYQL